MKNPEKSNNPRELLSKLRDGDYAHAGGQEAIDMVLGLLAEITKNNNKDKRSISFSVLDAGCGRGGTAAYIQKHTHFKVTGIDIDKIAIQYASERYKEIIFLEKSIMEIDSDSFTNSFDLIYLFNVFYALKNQPAGLKRLANAAKTGTILILFDYIYHDPYVADLLKDLADNPIHPIIYDFLRPWMTAAGWEIIAKKDLSKNYQEWYQQFISKLEKNRENLLQQFTEEAYNKVHGIFSNLLTQINKNQLGGTVIFANYKGHVF